MHLQCNRLHIKTLKCEKNWLPVCDSNYFFKLSSYGRQKGHFNSMHLQIFCEISLMC